MPTLEYCQYRRRRGTWGADRRKHNLLAHYDFETVHSITDSTFVSHVSFIGTDEDGEPTPMMLPLTAVLGNYGDGDNVGPEMSDEDLERHQKNAMRQGPANVYLHGNAAAMLCKAIKNSGTGAVKVCICSTKGTVLVLDGEIVLCAFREYRLYSEADAQ